MMIERTQSQTPWAEQIREGLERARRRLITEPGEPPVPESDEETPTLDPSSERGEALSEP